MKKWIFVLIFALLLTATGCDTLPPSGTDGSQPSGSQPSGTQPGEEKPDVLMMDASLIFHKYILEHTVSPEGRVKQTELRGTDYSYGIVLGRLEYVYGDDGALQRIEYYGRDSMRFSHYTGKLVLTKVYEFTPTDSGYRGTARQVDEFGFERDGEDEITVTVENGTVRQVNWNDYTVEFDENGKKTGEHMGECVAAYTYDDRGWVTGCQITQGEYRESYTVEYGENGYLCAYTRESTGKSSHSRYTMTFEIDDGGRPRHYECEEIWERPEETDTYTTTVTLDYTEFGAICSMVMETSGDDWKNVRSQTLTYNDKEQIASLTDAASRNGDPDDTREQAYTYDENGRISQKTESYYRPEEGGSLALVDTGTTVYTRNSNGQVVKAEYTEEPSGNRRTVDYVYDDRGNCLREEENQYYDGDSYYGLLWEYEYDAQNRKRKETESRFSEKGVPYEIEVHEYDENNYMTMQQIVEIENGVEKLKLLERHTYVHEKLGPGARKTTRESVEYDENGEPLRKEISVYISKDSPVSGNNESVSYESYEWKNGEWVKQD